MSPSGSIILYSILFKDVYEARSYTRTWFFVINVNNSMTIRLTGYSHEILPLFFPQQMAHLDA
jgi:hypothetical protein